MIRRLWEHTTGCRLAWTALFLSLGTPGLVAEKLTPEPDFQLPPPEVRDILDRDRHYDELEALSPDGRHFAIPVQQYFSTYEVLGRKTYRLAMLEIVPEANREWRLSSYGVKGLKIYSLEEQRSWDVQLPPEILLSDLVWSPDSRRLAFLLHSRNRTEVWVADVATGQARAVSDSPVMATLAKRPRRGRGIASPSNMLQWLPDGSLLTLLVPDDRGPEPDPAQVPSGPIIRTTREKPTPTRTYPFLLGTPHDQALFRYHTTAQLARLREGQAPQKIGGPAMYTDISLSADGQYLLAEKIVEPLSYIVDYNGFPRELEVLDLEGQILSAIRKIPLQESLRRRGARGPEDDLPRDVRWRPDGPVLSLLWREPKPEEGDEEEGDNEESEGPRKDRLMALGPPFDLDEARTLADSDQSFTQLEYSFDGRFALARMTGKGAGTSDRHKLVSFDLSAATPAARVLLDDIDPKDKRKDPGGWVTRRTGNGISYALMSSQGPSVYLEGEGLRDDFRPRPFVDRLNATSGDRERVFESSEGYFDQPKAFPDPDLRRLVFARESKTDFPDSFLWQADGDPVRLTSNQDPFPEVAGCRRIDFEFQRRDGLKIQARITLPVGYQQGSRVPAVFWTYPREYESAKEYRQRAMESRNRKAFPHLNYRNASEIWLTQGYAVVVPDIPILGGRGEYNNNYLAHLVDSMYGAIREIDRMGYVDIDRLGHGGHSYGAFATGNILAHTPFFKAGIAGDGAYNRTLTPMTFQAERRFLWEAQDTILEMSPFFYADHLDTPLLMYHGAVDNNTGTFLMQSERMIQALTGLGKTAVLYVYPFESHGPRAKETYLDLWSRWLAWFDQHVKGAGQAEEVSEEPTGATR